MNPSAFLCLSRLKTLSLLIVSTIGSHTEETLHSHTIVHVTTFVGKPNSVEDRLFFGSSDYIGKLRTYEKILDFLEPLGSRFIRGPN